MNNFKIGDVVYYIVKDSNTYYKFVIYGKNERSYMIPEYSNPNCESKIHKVTLYDIFYKEYFVNDLTKFEGVLGDDLYECEADVHEAFNTYQLEQIKKLESENWKKNPTCPHGRNVGHQHTSYCEDLDCKFIKECDDIYCKMTPF